MELCITFLAGFSILVGALVVKLTDNKEIVEHISMAMALGALIALLLFDLLPEIAEAGGNIGWIFIGLMIVLGIGILVGLDGFIPEHEELGEGEAKPNNAHIGLISALAIMVHNIVEGMTVYNMLSANLLHGLFFALGISLHNIPMGMMIYATMIPHKRQEKVVLFGCITFSTLLGGLIMYAVSGHLSDMLIAGLLAIAFGMIIYIVVWELLPHVARTKAMKENAIGFVLGFGVVFLSTLLG